VREVHLRAGLYRIGAASAAGLPSEGLPEATVRLAAFALDVTEVTVAQYAKCVAAGACDTHELDAAHGCNWGKSERESHPINCISYEQALRFCEWAGKRLPSEEEWEAAVRLDYPHDYGMDVTKACHRCDGSYAGLAAPGCNRTPGTCPVGTHALSGSQLGLLDVVGNVAEWTSGRFCRFNKPWCAAPVLRGSTWASSQYETVSQRMAGPKAVPNRESCREAPLVGARCARTLK
jgi:formylglycine-generating enzyme required for sulfatase activity